MCSCTLIEPVRPVSNQPSNGLGMAKTDRVDLETGKDRLENLLPGDRRYRIRSVREPSDPPYTSMNVMCAKRR